MLTRVLLAAGVAALAIAAPAGAERGDKNGGKGERAQSANHDRGSNHARSAARRSDVSAHRVQRVERVRAPRAERTHRFAGMERRQERANRVQRVDRQEIRARRADRQELRTNRINRQELRAQRVNRQELRAQRVNRQELRAQRVNRQELRAQHVDRKDLRAHRVDRKELRIANRGALRDQRQLQRFEKRFDDRQLRAGSRMAAFNQGAELIRVREYDGGVVRFREIDRDDLIARRLGQRFVSPAQAVTFVGEPISMVTQTVALAPMPVALRSLYLDDDDYYYRYGGGYAYRVDRNDDLISSLIPLAFGGLLPGQIMPTNYMSSYVPDYYGFNNFYPDSPYDCHRYVNGVVYEVDCVTGMIEDAVPLYASGYGVGQMLPAGYGHYNVPYEYRDMYYNTSDHNYWYAPGAIYQVDPGSSLITAVASLLTPGFSVGQQLPMGYDVYNVPYSYRSTYYDTPEAWYRYNNGNIYQVDPTTQLVTAIVASILT